MKAYKYKHTFKYISTAFDVLWGQYYKKYANFVCKVVLFFLKLKANYKVSLIFFNVKCVEQGCCLFFQKIFQVLKTFLDF